MRPKSANALVMTIVCVACRIRDIGPMGDPGELLDALDKAVDEWRDFQARDFPENVVRARDLA